MQFVYVAFWSPYDRHETIWNVCLPDIFSNPRTDIAELTQEVPLTFGF